MGWGRAGGAWADRGRLPGNSLSGVLDGRDIVLGGGSQVSGAETGQYGAIGAPYSTFPAGLSLTVNGVVKVAYDAVAGVEVGIAYHLSQNGKGAGLRILRRTVASTSAADWVSTHFATAAADVVTAGMQPRVFVYAVSGQEAINAAAAAAYHQNLRALAQLVYATWLGCGFLVMHLQSTDLGTYPQKAAANAVATAFCSEPGGRRKFLDTQGVELQADATHATAAGIVDVGLRCGRAILLEAAL